MTDSTPCPGSAGNGQGFAAATAWRLAFPARRGCTALPVAFAILLAAMAGVWARDAGPQGASDDPQAQAESPTAPEETDQPPSGEEAQPGRKIEEPAAEREDDKPAAAGDAADEPGPSARPNADDAQRQPDADDDDETMGEEPAASVDSATSSDSRVGRKKVAKKHAQPDPPPPHLGLCDPRPRLNQLFPPCMTPEMYEKLHHDPAWLAKRDRYRAHLLYVPPACSMPGEQKAVECPHFTAEQVAAAKKQGQEQILVADQACRRNCGNFYATCYDRSFCPKKRRECLGECDSERAERESSQRSYEKYLDSQLDISVPKFDDGH